MPAPSQAATPFSLTEAIAHYLHAMALNGRSPCTIRNARGALRELAGFMLDLNIGDIREMSHEALLRYRERLARRLTPRGTPLRVASQCEHLGCLRAFCSWMIEQDWLAADPMRRIPQPRRRRHLPRAILEPEEVALLCSLPDLRTPAGCRDVFLNRFGGGIQPIGVWHIVRKYARRSGIGKPVSTHTLRHSCATHMARAGAPIRHLQELLGHASIETTQIYTQLTITDVKDAHRRFHPGERDAPQAEGSPIRWCVP